MFYHWQLWFRLTHVTQHFDGTSFVFLSLLYPAVSGSFEFFDACFLFGHMTETQIRFVTQGVSPVRSCRGSDNEAVWFHSSGTNLKQLREERERFLSVQCWIPQRSKDKKTQQVHLPDHHVKIFIQRGTTWQNIYRPKCVSIHAPFVLICSSNDPTKCQLRLAIITIHIIIHVPSDFHIIYSYHHYHYSFLLLLYLSISLLSHVTYFISLVISIGHWFCINSIYTLYYLLFSLIIHFILLFSLLCIYC